MPTAESRLSGPWRDTATLIQTGAYRIYFHGTATPAAAPTGFQWSGTVAGDIFLITPQGYMLIPEGKLTVSPNGAISTSGVSKSMLIDQPGHSR